MIFDPGDSRIDAGISLFNSAEFFECHDVFEDLWSELVGPEKPFFQELIHASVCLFHFEGGNLAGARKMYSSFQIYTAEFTPTFVGIEVERLRKDMEQCFSDLLAVKSGYPSHIILQPERIPQIHRNWP